MHGQVAAEHDADGAAVHDAAVDEQPRAAGHHRAAREPAHEREALQGVVRALDEAVDGEGERVGEDDADHVVVTAHRHAENRYRVRRAEHLEMEGAHRHRGQRGDPDADAVLRLDALAGGHHAVRAAADARARADERRRMDEGALGLLGGAAGDEHAGEVGGRAVEHGERRGDGALRRDQEVGVDGEAVTDAGCAHLAMVTQCRPGGGDCTGPYGWTGLTSCVHEEGSRTRRVGRTVEG